MLSFICALIIILATAYWAYYGVFSAVIMFGEALISLMVAFSAYEPLANMWKETFSKALAEPAFLVVTFFVTLIILRFVTDKFIPGQVNVHLAIDRVGGGIFGFLTGMLSVGVCLIGAQMLPLGRTTFGFERYSTLTDGTLRRNSLAWFSPDDFTVGLVNMLSDQRFSWNDVRFDHEKPQFLDSLYYQHLGTQAEARTVVPQDAITVTGVRTVNQIKKLSFTTKESGDIVRNTEAAAPKDHDSWVYLVCDIEMKRPPGPTDPANGQGYMQEVDYDDNGNPTPKDMVLFTPGQFRLVGPKPADATSPPPKVYPAVGISDIYLRPKSDKVEPLTKSDMETLVRLPQDTSLVLGDERQKDILPKDGPFKLQVVFEVPGDTEFKPWYVEFKQGAKALIPEKRAEPAGGTRRAPRQDRATKVSDTSASGGDGSKNSDANAANSSSSEKPADTTSAARTEPDQPKAKIKVGQAPGGRTHINNVIEKGTDVTDALPRPLLKSGLRSMMQGGKVGNGHVWLDVPDKEPPESDLATKFVVPDGKKLVQVSAEQVYAGSMFGQALEVATRVVNQNYLTVDSDPDKLYFAQGAYIEAKVDGKDIVEIQYWTEPEQPERCMQAPTKLTPAALRGRTDFKLVYLFIVDPGVRITKFHASPRRSQELIIEVPQ